MGGMARSSDANALPHQPGSGSRRGDRRCFVALRMRVHEGEGTKISERGRRRATDSHSPPLPPRTPATAGDTTTLGRMEPSPLGYQHDTKLVLVRSCGLPRGVHRTWYVVGARGEEPGCAMDPKRRDGPKVQRLAYHVAARLRAMGSHFVLCGYVRNTQLTLAAVSCSVRQRSSRQSGPAAQALRLPALPLRHAASRLRPASSLCWP